MIKHTYISERMECKTYIKGTFRGKFTGQLDRDKSDDRHERFFDLEITEGEITTAQSHITRWQQGGESLEFSASSGFRVRLPGDIHVALRYLDNSVKYFRVRLQEIKLIHCRLSNQVYNGSEVMGVIEGDVSGYIMHYETVIQEVIETPEPEILSEPREKIIVEPPVDEKPPIQPIPEPPKWNFWTWIKNGAGFTPLRSLFFLLSLLIVLLLARGNWALVILCMSILLWLLPRSHSRFGNLFNFRFRSPMLIIVRLYLSGILIFSIARLCIEEKEKWDKNKIAERQRMELMARQKEDLRQRKDSFDYHFEKVKSFESQGSNVLALQELKRAEDFVSDAESAAFNSESIKIYSAQGESLIKTREYNQALAAYTRLIALDRTNASFLYKRALCYLDGKRMREAVADLKKAIALGDKPANVLHEQVNPLKKRVAYYVTLCNDGTTSDAKGRGACSHHGGVQNWNHPVYEEYREFE